MRLLALAMGAAFGVAMFCFVVVLVMSLTETEVWP